MGSWLQTQKMVRAGKRLGSLSDAQIALLDDIGMVWENRMELQFEKNFQYAEHYASEHGDLLVPATYQTDDGFRLGAWIHSLRQRYADIERTGMLSEEHRSRLDEIGMQWNITDYNWEKNFAEVLAWYQANGSLSEVPAKYRTEHEFALGAWLQNLRRAYQGKSKNRVLTREQIEQLDAFGMR